MTKKLYIIRHAKSDWKVGVSDFERPLNPRGISDAPKMGSHLKSLSIVPDLIISSTANRAISTARLVAQNIGYPLNEIKEKQSAYNALYSDLIKLIASVHNEVKTLFLFAHNPGVSDLVYYLTGEPIELKTCCVAQLDLLVDSWSEVFESTCELKLYTSPKSI